MDPSAYQYVLVISSVNIWLTVHDVWLSGSCVDYSHCQALRCFILSCCTQNEISSLASGKSSAFNFWNAWWYCYVAGNLECIGIQDWETAVVSSTVALLFTCLASLARTLPWLSCTMTPVHAFVCLFAFVCILLASNQQFCLMPTLLISWHCLLFENSIAIVR